MTVQTEPREEELVTKALVRYADLPLGAGTSAIITLDNGFDHTKPNTFGLGGLASLAGALDEIAARGDLAAVCLTGKPFIFSVGADVKAVSRATNRDQPLELGRRGHAVFKRLRELGVPSFAFVNGAAMGGGVEAALSCEYRTISSDVPAFSLPECFLGLIPGWGGTYLLPNLIGAPDAIKVIIENPLNQNRMLKPKQVFQMGIADALLEPADFLEQSLLWAAKVVNGDITVERKAIDRGQAWDEAVAAGRAFVAAKVGDAAPAPQRGLDLISLAKTGTRDECDAAEDEAIADLVMGNELRAGLYAFFLVQRRAKRPVGVPDKSLATPITKVGVVGAGLMASQLALLFASRLQVPVVMTDIDQQRVDKGVGYAYDEIDKLAGRGRLSGDKVNKLKGLITGSASLGDFADADLVIEAVFEDLKVKQQVFVEVEAVVSESCILATNTSSLSVTEMASVLKHPERVVGLHFFNPVAIMPLLEIVRGDKTNDATLATAFVAGKKLKKSCVLVKDAPAFVVNRLLTRFMGEITRSVDEGTPFEVADKALDPLGLPMSPFILMSLVGPAVALHVSETMKQAFPDRFYVSDNLKRMVAAGKTAIWSWDGGTQHLDPEIAEIFEQGDNPLTEEQVRDRALEAMAQEIRLMLDEGVVAEPQDIDLCMIMGAGWPFHLGGITPYLDRTGVSERVTGKRFLEPGISTLPE